jgi:hypothetical protein
LHGQDHACLFTRINDVKEKRPDGSPSGRLRRSKIGLGRPTAYKPEYCELAHNYCLLGATAEELAGFFGVTRGTINNWIATIPEFATALREGRDLADARVARCLFARAVGYSHKVERTVLHRGQERTISNIGRYPPDTQACIFWLRNRRRQTWQERAVSEPDDEPDFIAMLDAARESMRNAGD